jgi:hypothetical protein
LNTNKHDVWIHPFWSKKDVDLARNVVEKGIFWIF